MTLATGEAVLLALAAGFGWVLAGLLHELTHILTVWPLARSVRVDISQMRVTAEIPEEEMHQRAADALGIAPVLVGVLVAIGLGHVGYPLPAVWRPEGVAAWAVWARYTVGGGVVDFVPRLAWEDTDAPEADADGVEADTAD